MNHIKELIKQIEGCMFKRKVEMFNETANNLMNGKLQTPSEAIEYMNWIKS